MHLGGTDRFVELAVIEYEMPPPSADEPYDPETDWLVLRAHVRDGASTHTFDGLSLDVAEFHQLVGWMQAVALERIGPASAPNEAAIIFVEPDLAARVIAWYGHRRIIRWYFADADATLDPPDDERSSWKPNYAARSFDIDTATHDLDVAAADLLHSLTTLGERGIER